MGETKKGAAPHPHDLLVRNMLGEPDLAADLLKNYLSRDWASRLDFDNLKREPTESINRELVELLGDLRYSTTFKGSERKLNVFIFLEHQSQPDRFMSFRLHQYVCAAYGQYLSTRAKRKNVTFPYPLAVVLHHGKTPWKKVTPMRELIDMPPGETADILQLPIFLIDLARIPREELHGHPAVCALLDSLQSASTGRLKERISDIFGRLLGIRDERRSKSWIISLATYYASIQSRVRDGVDDFTQIFTKLCGKREAEKMTLTIAESWILEGKEQGKAESTITFLEARFGKVPARLKKKIGSLKDPKRLEKALKLAATSGSLKEFQDSL